MDEPDFDYDVAGAGLNGIDDEDDDRLRGDCNVDHRGRQDAIDKSVEQGEEEDDDENDEAALRAALHFYVGEICSAETEGRPMTGAAVSALAEAVFKYTEALALDLRVFAKHGKRAVVGVDDVKCVARKDPSMVQKLMDFEAMHLRGGKNTRKKKATDTTGATASNSTYAVASEKRHLNQASAGARIDGSEDDFDDEFML